MNLRSRTLVGAIVTLGWLFPAVIAAAGQGLVMRWGARGIESEASSAIWEISRLIVLLGWLLGPALALTWAKGRFPQVGKVPYVALVPLYVALVPWTFFDFRMHFLASDFLGYLGVPRMERLPWSTILAAAAYAPVSFLCGTWSAAWRARPPLRDFLSLVAATVVVLMLIRWIGPPPIL